MNMEEAWDAWLNAVVSFSHLLSTVNSSINFVIYCYKDDKFRDIFIKLLKSPFGFKVQSQIVIDSGPSMETRL